MVIKRSAAGDAIERPPCLFLSNHWATYNWKIIALHTARFSTVCGLPSVCGSKLRQKTRCFAQKFFTADPDQSKKMWPDPRLHLDFSMILSLTKNYYRSSWGSRRHSNNFRSSSFIRTASPGIRASKMELRTTSSLTTSFLPSRQLQDKMGLSDFKI